MIDGKRKCEMTIRSGAGENFLFFELYYFLIKRGKNINRKVGMMIGSAAGTAAASNRQMESGFCPKTLSALKRLIPGKLDVTDKFP